MMIRKLLKQAKGISIALIVKNGVVFEVKIGGFGKHVVLSPVFLLVLICYREKNIKNLLAEYL